MSKEAENYYEEYFSLAKKKYEHFYVLSRKRMDNYCIISYPKEENHLFLKDDYLKFNYEIGKNDVPTKILIKLANFYNTSTDYLLGITDEIKPYPSKNNEKRRTINKYYINNNKLK